MDWTVWGLNPSGGEIFRTCPDRPWGPLSLLYNGYRVFPRSKEQPVCDTDPLPPSSAIGHERLELYLYSPYGPYGLYRASVPVQGCTLPLPLTTSAIFSINRHSSVGCVKANIFLPRSIHGIIDELLKPAATTCLPHNP